VNGIKQPSALLNNNSRIHDEEMFVIPLYVKGNVRPIVAYRDTGSLVTLVNSAYVKKHEYTGDQIEVSGLFGPPVHIPIARIQVKSPKFLFEGYVTAEVGVVETQLPFGADVLLGNGIFAFNKHIRDIINVEGAPKRCLSNCVDDLNADVNLPVGQSQSTCPNNDQHFQSLNSDQLTNSFKLETVEATSSQVPADVESSDGCVCDKPFDCVGGDQPDVKYVSDSLDANEFERISHVEGSSLPHTEAIVHAYNKRRVEPSRNPINREDGSGLSMGPNDCQARQVVEDDMQRAAVIQRSPREVSSCDSSGGGHTLCQLNGRRHGSRCVTNERDAAVNDEFTRLAAIDPAVVNKQFYEQPTDKQVELADLQRADSKLQSIWNKAKTGKGGFIVRSGFLMKKRSVNAFGENEYVLVLPDCKKRQVLVAAHDDPRSGGHVGFKRTYQKISRVFYMPKREIKEFCATCSECQRLKPKCINERVDYILPEIEGEFGHTWIIDVMGPTMERMSRKFGGHAHILVCIEAATRWVELIALPSLKAAALAAVIESNLITRFACRKLVYDLQSGLMSDLMQSVLKLLRVKSHISVAAFHARTAVAERYCRTVERYLKPYLEEYRGKWGLLLPWISFQLRQTPCSVTHFSPHEMVLGKNFPDQLDDLRDDFMGLTDATERSIKTNVLSYVNDLCKRLSLTRELASKYALIEHERTKSWYDKHCTPEKTFKAGDKVLILEPVDSRKMFAKWSEPAEIVKPSGLRTYEVRLADDTVKSFHVNQLRAVGGATHQN
jgi:hypothetical protein